MPGGRYGNLFFEKPIVEGRFAPRLKIFSKNFVGDKNFSLLWNCITQPFLMVEESHTHDFDQFLHFYGADSMDISDFDAEVELSLGEEGEKHIITETTVVHIPKGMLHCPLFFKVINKPVIFMNVALTPEYVKTKP